MRELFFLREKPVLALLAVKELEPAYAAVVAKRIDSTFPHTCNILSQLEALGFIESRPEGRVRYLSLSERGLKVAKALQDLLEILQKPDLQQKKLLRVKQLIISSTGPGASMRVGPLRRDLVKIKAQGHGEIYRIAEELDNNIRSLLRDGNY